MDFPVVSQLATDATQQWGKSSRELQKVNIATPMILPPCGNKKITTFVCVMGHTLCLCYGPHRRLIPWPGARPLAYLPHLVRRGHASPARAFKVLQRDCPSLTARLSKKRGPSWGTGAVGGCRMYLKGNLSTLPSKLKNQVRDSCPEAHCPEVQCTDFNFWIS